MTRLSEQRAGAAAQVSREEILHGCDGVLLDAYGVLADKTVALPGAAGFAAQPEDAQTPFPVPADSGSRTEEERVVIADLEGFPCLERPARHLRLLAR